MTTDSQPGASSDLALLGLMQLVSPALPIGAFAWSQGLESAFELGWVKTEADLQEWLEGVLEDGLSRCELPLLARLQTAWATEDAQAIAQSQLYYMEGYLAASPTGLQAALAGKAVAKEAGVALALTLSDMSMINFCRDGLDAMLDGGVDYLFCN